jgi:phosphoesterase RecJ-like protein
MTETCNQIVELIKCSERIVITSHKGPDGDSIGSSLGLYFFIQQLGKKSVVCHPDEAPKFLKWLNGVNTIVAYETNPLQVKELLANADLIFCLDYNAPDRVGQEMAKDLVAAGGKKVMIDHHMFPADFCDVVISETTCCSTSQLIYELIDQSVNSDLIDENIGTPLYLGIMTDTGSFRFPSVQPRTHEIIADLLRKGVKHSVVHEKVYDSNTLDRLQLRGFAIAERFQKLNGFPVAIISLTAADLDRFNYQKGDTEGLVNVALSVDGIMIAGFFMEKDGIIKISFRSKGDYFVNEMAMNEFSGGGHKYAAGGMSEDNLQNTIEKFKNLVPTYFS